MKKSIKVTSLLRLSKFTLKFQTCLNLIAKQEQQVVSDHQKQFPLYKCFGLFTLVMSLQLFGHDNEKSTCTRFRLLLLIIQRFFRWFKRQRYFKNYNTNKIPCLSVFHRRPLPEPRPPRPPRPLRSSNWSL